MLPCYVAMLPCYAMPCPALLCAAMPCPAMCCHFFLLSCYAAAMQCHALLCYALLLCFAAVSVSLFTIHYSLVTLVTSYYLLFTTLMPYAVLCHAYHALPCHVRFCCNALYTLCHAMPLCRYDSMLCEFCFAMPHHDVALLWWFLIKAVVDQVPRPIASLYYI